MMKNQKARRPKARKSRDWRVSERSFRSAVFMGSNGFNRRALLIQTAIGGKPLRLFERIKTASKGFACPAGASKEGSPGPVTDNVFHAEDSLHQTETGVKENFEKF